jgi:Fe2+ transport system protein FeoA
MLRYLARIDLHLGNIMEVVERPPVNGPLVIRIATAQHILSQELASRIYVTVLETP